MDCLIEEMSTKFNCEMNSMNSNLKYDSSLKWKSLLNNKYAKKIIESKELTALNGNKKTKSSKFQEKRKEKFLKDIGLRKVKHKRNNNLHHIQQKDKRINKSSDISCTCENQIPKFYVKKNSNSVFCNAIDSVNNKKIGCSNLVRPEGDLIRLSKVSPKVQYMILCEQHQERLKIHNCCAGCGIFCTQGTFLSCRVRHISHIRCAQKRNNKNSQDVEGHKCVHCGLTSKESFIGMTYVLMKETSVL
ncbi:EHMT1 family protein [Megaselia abdita]